MVDRNALDGRVAPVAGSTTGLGFEIAKELDRLGARVGLNYEGNRERAERAFEEYSKFGFEGGIYQANVCAEVSVGDLVGDIERDLGSIDILVPNATGPQPEMPV